MLTTLGIVIGNGTRAQLEAQIAGMGQNIIMVFPNFHGGGVSASGASGQVIFGNQNWPSSVYGVSAEYLQIKSWDVESGTMFSQQQVASAAKVALLGATVVDELFEEGNPVGEINEFATGTSKTITALLGAVAGVSLVVGGALES